jgi:tRNA A-37 threonylcarbamoyl transferase component Bud32
MDKQTGQSLMIGTEQMRKVEEALRPFLAQNGRGSFARLEVIQSIERPFSIIVFFRAHTDRAPYDAVLKKVVHHPMNLSLTMGKNQADVEFAMISTLFPYFREERGCGVPEPIAVFPEEESYLMEYVHGELLSDKLVAARYFSSGQDFANLCNWYRLCGRWLKRFQEVTATQLATKDIFSSTLIRCREKLDMIIETGDSRCPLNLKEKVLVDLDRQLAKIADDKVLSAGRHGDFGSWNIQVNDTGITVFDFLGSQEDSVAVDVLKMLINFEDEKHYLVYSRRKVEELKKNFLDGYGALPKIQRPVAVICETLHRVCSVCASVAHTDGSSLRRRYEKHLSLQEHLAWLYSEAKVLSWPNVTD